MPGQVINFIGDYVQCFHYETPQSRPLQAITVHNPELFIRRFMRSCA